MRKYYLKATAPAADQKYFTKNQKIKCFKARRHAQKKVGPFIEFLFRDLRKFWKFRFLPSSLLSFFPF